MTYNTQGYQNGFSGRLRCRSLQAELVKRFRLDNDPAGIERAVIDHQKDNAGGHRGREDCHIGGGCYPAGMHGTDCDEE